MDVPTDRLPVLATFARPRVREPLSIAVLGDPHVSPRAEGTTKVYHRSLERLQSAMDDAERRHVRAILSVGDLTKDGAPWEFEAVDGLIESIDVPFFAIPGNHDVPKRGDEHDSPALERFVDLYTPGSLPFRLRLGELDVLAVNTAVLPDASLQDRPGGAVPAGTIRWLRETLPESDAPLVMLHHNTPAMVHELEDFRVAVGEDGLDPLDEWSFFLRNPDELLDVLAEHEVPLVVTGHLHVPGVANNAPVWEVTAPGTGSFPQAYLLLEIGPDGTTVRYVPIPGPTGMREAFLARRGGGEFANLLVDYSTIQLASLPLGVE